MTARPLAIPALALAVAALVSPAGCSQKQAAPPRESVPVSVASASVKDVPVQVTAIGHVEAYATVSLKAQVGGEITKIGFKEGQDVSQGDLLFLIDPRPFEATLAQARANLERDRARAKNAEEDARRYGSLVQKDFATPQQYDEMRSNAAAAAATVKADEAAVENTRLQLEYCRITAPISGRTGSLLVHAGNVVKANDDKPLLVINQIQPIYVTFAVPESALSQIQARSAGGRKLTVTAAPPDSPENAQTGELTFLDNAVDRATGTITLKATFANASRSLWPGQFANVVMTLATEPNALTVPTQAVQTGQSGQYVYVVKSDLTVESRPVTVARTHGALAIVSKGLAAGERVVTDGQLRLAPGAAVQIKEPQGRTS